MPTVFSRQSNVKEADVNKVLRLARSYVGQGITKDAHARNSRGESVPYYEQSACRFCTQGALARAATDLNNGKIGPDYMEAHRRMELVLGGDIPDVNDRPRTSTKMVYDSFTLALSGAWKGLE